MKSIANQSVLCVLSLAFACAVPEETGDPVGESPFDPVDDSFADELVEKHRP
jgi:hypothetical protein